jgi:hypothetical protein
MLVVEELLSMVSQRDQQELIDIINLHGGQRKSYNMWLFHSINAAENFVFLYKLKYEN